MKILIVEDNRDITSNIADYLEPEGWQLDFADNGKLGLQLALDQYYDLVILDLMLPGMDGWQLCAELRCRANRHIPVLMLTARDSLNDKVKGFELGADDYLTKPFALEELKMRCQALIRRHELNQEHKLRLGPLVIDKPGNQVWREGQRLDLNPIPYKILLLLAQAYPRVVSRSELIERIWQDEPTDSDALRSHIYQLRQKLDKPFTSPMLHTLQQIGFTLKLPHEPS
ncbi:response regulator transcription factor [Lacimicrobium alkaliphilum]|uniref:XRE family transcriptional regulator n=1 Tax=Lacimicrobium alkaliphilum TaxID=1526571 RepID=A0A0U2RML7_9ALTE|nr:response regulator transcription factor [Lacimicrobium alkaliphilum]ALS98522.1 XRE family transcriptional regulator [Lacimicrobium alkaliphilum]